MKYLNTILLLAIAVALGANFYMDFKRDAAYKTRLETTSIPKKEEEPSPFDKLPSDPMHDTQTIHSGPVTKISFERTAHDFGRVESGPTYKTSFKFTNTGNADLIISNAKASCGCTVPSYSDEPIKPGQTGEIKVEFDSKGRVGEQLKLISVTTNTAPNENVLTVKSNPYLKTN